MKDQMNQIGKMSMVVTLLILTSCASTSYVGLSHTETDKVDIFFDAENITGAYEIIGRAIGEGHRLKKVQSKLIDRAKQEGADAILIDGIGKDNYGLNGHVAGAVNSIDQINATFLKYK